MTQYGNRKSKTLKHPLKIGTNDASFPQPYVETHCIDVSSSPGVIVLGLVTTSVLIGPNWKTETSVKVLIIYG